MIVDTVRAQPLTAGIIIFSEKACLVTIVERLLYKSGQYTYFFPLDVITMMIHDKVTYMWRFQTQYIALCLGTRNRVRKGKSHGYLFTIM